MKAEYPGVEPVPIGDVSIAEQGLTDKATALVFYEIVCS